MRYLERDRILTAALLWLREHYDVGDRRQAAKVLAVVDRVLDDGAPLSALDQRVFTATYAPVKPAKDCMRRKDHTPMSAWGLKARIPR